MTFQAYLDTIRTKTGLGPQEFHDLALAKGLAPKNAKAGEIVAWLKQDFGLGHGHAMAIWSVLRRNGAPRPGSDDALDALFAGSRSPWRPWFDRLSGQMREFGGDVSLAPGRTYVALNRAGRKFAIVQPAAGHLDVGIKCPGVPPVGRFASAKGWNAMVTHRVRILSHDDDDELVEWLRDAHDAAAGRGASAR